MGGWIGSEYTISFVHTRFQEQSQRRGWITHDGGRWWGDYLMKKLFLLFALLCGMASAQVDIINSDIGPYHVLGRNLVPASSGVGGLLNNFIFTPLNPNQGVCLYLINDTSTPATGVGLTMSQTGDPGVSKFAGNTGKWIQINTQSLGSLTGTFSYYVQPSGAARIAISSGGSGATTMDLIAVETGSGSQCGPSSAYALHCPFSVTVAVASGATTLVIGGDGAGGRPARVGIHICSYHLSVAGATVAAAHNAFKAGSGATCGGATATIWQIDTGATEDQLMLSAAPGGQLFETNLAFSPSAQIGGPNLNLCYTDGGTTAGTKVNVTYNAF